jgi:hypothetical protein
LTSFFRSRPLDYYLLWLAIIVSLAINAFLLNFLIQARQQVGQAAGSAAVAVGQLRTSSIDYPIEIQESLPVSLTVTYQEDIAVPISVTLPINTLVSVPLRTPVGNFPINVPVVANIPISLTTVVPLDVAIPISMSIPIDVSFPIHVDLADTALGESLSGAELYLRQLASDLGADSPSPIEPWPPAGPSPTP